VATATIAAMGWTAGGHVTVLCIVGAAFVAADFGFLAWGRRYLSWLASGLASASFLAAGILGHFPLLIWISTAGIVGFLLWFWWGGPRGRKRARKELGDESRRLRDGLVRRMRQRRVTRPGWSPSPLR
jgi:hypothetical protein